MHIQQQIQALTPTKKQFSNVKQILIIKYEYTLLKGLQL
jgi:hypothetical protein